tara:strand:- start:219 stop:437 length:219 start_codon:yes stop_codon:yes gene_type:complete
MIIDRLISIKLEDKSIVQLTTEVIDLMTGSIELAGAGGVVNGSYRDFELEANSNKELNTFLDLLNSKGYNIA